MQINREYLKDSGYKIYTGKISNLKQPRGKILKILITEIECKENDITIDHVWIIATHELRTIKMGSIIRFKAKPELYLKGYRGNLYQQYDNPVQAYTLSDLKEIEVVK